jgi:hypothetical protein
MHGWWLVMDEEPRLFYLPPRSSGTASMMRRTRQAHDLRRYLNHWPLFDLLLPGSYLMTCSVSEPYRAQIGIATISMGQVDRQRHRMQRVVLPFPLCGCRPTLKIADCNRSNTGSRFRLLCSRSVISFFRIRPRPIRICASESLPSCWGSRRRTTTGRRQFVHMRQRLACTGICPSRWSCARGPWCG